ncbi:hypothetical protein QVD17_00632 [Tagetes erecta]|uniref:Uncharacterized protein n=1 Tax=Tagetes erecta TaxID=13708 RepID=A0AAD8L5G9_TARER|nr:hypothetical protein QVD17_00632 [Tagetes erecta]
MIGGGRRWPLGGGGGRWWAVSGGGGWWWWTVGGSTSERVKLASLIIRTYKFPPSSLPYSLVSLPLKSLHHFFFFFFFSYSLLVLMHRLNPDLKYSIDEFVLIRI